MKRAAAFVAIVWGVAATFVVSEIAALRVTDLAVAYQDLFGNLLLSRAVSGSRTCEAGNPDLVADNRASDGQAWILGLLVGHDAIFRQFTSVDSQALEALAAQADRSAAALGVNAPERFTPQYQANAHSEFVVFVEADGTETARGLARRHSTRACYLYKLGALWGYTEVLRRVLPGERAGFALEIRHYARLAEVPEELWRPMLGRTPPNATPADLDASTSALTDAMTRYVSN
jgi:hypothetical protein